MSHEIRTPMNARDRHERPAARHAAHDEQRDFAGTIRDSGDALLTIINDILDFSKIEAGRMDIERSRSTCAKRRVGARPGRDARRREASRPRLRVRGRGAAA
jgi:signal transduction histidine kinase